MGGLSLTRLLSVLLVISSLAGCASYGIDQHAAADEIPSSLSPMLVISRIGSTGSPLQESFRSAVLSGLAACGITADLRQADDLELNVDRSLGPVLRRKDLVSVLNIAVIGQANPATQTGKYLLILSTRKDQRQLWKARMHTDFAGLASNGVYRQAGATLGHGIIKQLAEDGVLRDCRSSDR